MKQIATVKVGEDGFSTLLILGETVVSSSTISVEVFQELADRINAKVPEPEIDFAQLLTEIDTWACMLPTFKVNHNGGPVEATQNITNAIRNASWVLTQLKNAKPVGKVLSDAEMYSLNYDGKAGNVIWWDKPKESKLIYAEPIIGIVRERRLEDFRTELQEFLRTQAKSFAHELLEDPAEESGFVAGLKHALSLLDTVLPSASPQEPSSWQARVCHTEVPTKEWGSWFEVVGEELQWYRNAIAKGSRTFELRPMYTQPFQM